MAHTKTRILHPVPAPPVMTLPAFKGTISWNPTATMSAPCPPSSHGCRSRPAAGLRPLTLYVAAWGQYHGDA